MTLFSSFNITILYTALAASCTAFLFSLLSCTILMRSYKHLLQTAVRDYVPERHKQKNNTPTMAGVCIVLSLVIASFIWCRLSAPRVLVMLVVMIGFGAIGTFDDWCKITKTRGIKARSKFALQCVVACVATSLWIYLCPDATTLVIPLINYSLPLQTPLVLAWAVFVMVASSNAVNLTDGLDGLAVGSLVPNYLLFSLLAYNYLHNQDLFVFGVCVIGSCLGFLWYNLYPARLFMGDSGSLSLGAGLACLALMSKQELLFIMSGAVFITEVISVILQVLSFKLRGKRIFRMAPIHHHFELCGIKETHITFLFSFISWLLCSIALLIYNYSH